MLKKYYKPFTLIVAKDQQWDVGYVMGSDDDCCVKFAELHSPTLKCMIIPMPRICRSSSRRIKEAEESMFLTGEPLELEKEKKK